MNMNPVLNHQQTTMTSSYGNSGSGSGPSGDGGGIGNRNRDGHGGNSDGSPMPIFIHENFCGGGGGLLIPEKGDPREFWKNYASIEVDEYDILINKNYSDKRNIMTQNIVKLKATLNTIACKEVWKHEPIHFIDALSRILIDIFEFLIEFPHSNLPSEYESDLVSAADAINYFFDWCKNICVENTLFPEFVRIIFECIAISASDNFFAYKRTLLVNEIIIKFEKIHLRVALFNACLTFAKGSFVTVYNISRKDRGLIPFSATNCIYRAFLLLEIILTGIDTDNTDPDHYYKNRNDKWIQEEQYHRLEAFQRCIEKQGIFFNVLEQVKRVTEIAKVRVKYSDLK